MKNCIENLFAKFKITTVFLFIFSVGFSQQNNSDFESKIRFGGGLGVSLGSGFTNIILAPSAIYDFNPYFSAGLGFQGSYVKQRNFYESFIYGPSVITLFNPIEELQISAELEQLRVNTEYEDGNLPQSENFWNTALFLGAGYRTQNVTVGIRYNVLHDDDKNIYANAFMPFVRVYF
ncbi:hypothetical protein GV828_10185 [Flavobacterium sp. NST-5]|uniref:Alpha-ketoglutarate decarboxylase n=1 Tax=Flavobacterium ichthyis TaxID=2698827 RepID=A0ABW9ZCS0_9FLAO|nr:hypothetical protein [Flavobacterium ichthyis]NBL65569.1 hypothetical protein [Flavobacterium ichthyis]